MNLLCLSPSTTSARTIARLTGGFSLEEIDQKRTFYPKTANPYLPRDASGTYSGVWQYEPGLVPGYSRICTQYTLLSTPLECSLRKRVLQGRVK